MADKFNLDGFSVDEDNVCTADGGFSGQITNDSITTAATKTSLHGAVTMTGLATSDPSIGGRLWIDTSAGFVVKVSQG
jgi:hypothetical protein